MDRLVAIERERSEELEARLQAEEAKRVSAEVSCRQMESTIAAVQQASQRQAELEAIALEETVTAEAAARLKVEEAAAQVTTTASKRRFSRAGLRPHTGGAVSQRALQLLWHARDPRAVRRGRVLPTPATHSILTQLKAGETVYPAEKRL